MIKLRGKVGQADAANKIIFEPRSGFNRGRGAAPSLEFPLIYGHRCPKCSNVIQALFKAPREFSLWPYEETVILSQGDKNSGEIRKVFPDEKAKFGKSTYRMEFSPAEGGSVKITLKNHIARHRALAERQFDGSGLWEVGAPGAERPCVDTGIFALREDLLVKDFLLFSQVENAELAKFNMPKLSDCVKENDPHFTLVPAVGEAPPVILIDRQQLVYGYHYQTRQILANFVKG